MRKILPIFIVIFYLVFSLIYPLNLYAQSFDIAYTYNVADSEARAGDIIVASSDKGLKRADAAYDSRMMGVLQDTPLLVYKKEGETGQPIVRTGDTLVNVTNFNGDIKAGDYVTSSPISGKGMKAIQSGYVIGIAIEDASPLDGTTSYEGQNYNLASVKVALRIEYAELTTARSNLRLLNSLNAALFKNLQDPEKFTVVIRYIMAGVVSFIAFTFGFWTMSRLVIKTMEAIGRNPLAKNSIQLSLGINILMILGALTAVVALALIIVRF